jgi:hypothetical protein
MHPRLVNLLRSMGTSPRYSHMPYHLYHLGRHPSSHNLRKWKDHSPLRPNHVSVFWHIGLWHRIHGPSPTATMRTTADVFVYSILVHIFTGCLHLQISPNFDDVNRANLSSCHLLHEYCLCVASSIRDASRGLSVMSSKKWFPRLTKLSNVSGCAIFLSWALHFSFADRGIGGNMIMDDSCVDVLPESDWGALGITWRKPRGLLNDFSSFWKWKVLNQMFAAGIVGVDHMSNLGAAF